MIEAVLKPIPDYLRSRITNVPASIKTRGRISKQIYVDIATTLKLIEVGQGIPFSEDEIRKAFGKCFLNNIKSGLYKFKLGKVDVNWDAESQKWYIYLRSRA